MGVKQLHEKHRQTQWVGTVVWWITLVVSSIFSIYTLPFITGKFDIYKFFTLSYGIGRIEEAGLHILRNVRLWQVKIDHSFMKTPSHNILCLKISGRSLYYENLSHNYISGRYCIMFHRVLCHGIDLMIFVRVNFELM